MLQMVGCSGYMRSSKFKREFQFRCIYVKYMYTWNVCLYLSYCDFHKTFIVITASNPFLKLIPLGSRMQDLLYEGPRLNFFTLQPNLNIYVYIFLAGGNGFEKVFFSILENFASC